MTAIDTTNHEEGPMTSADHSAQPKFRRFGFGIFRVSQLGQSGGAGPSGDVHSVQVDEMKGPYIYSGLRLQLGGCNFCNRDHKVVIVVESGKPGGGCQVRFCRKCRRALKAWVEK